MNNKGKDFNNLKLLISIFLIYMDKEIVEKKIFQMAVCELVNADLISKCRLLVASNKPNFKAEVAIVESLTHSTW